MSLYILPISVGDLTNFQFGIEFFINNTEAITEIGLINPPVQTATVDSYATQLLANNISLSQVAMAVDSLMFGVTDSVTELAKLTTQFLPPQVNVAVATPPINPTVYAAETLGLALADGNGTSHAFETDFGSLSVAQFASKAASLTGINFGAIQGFVQNWISFYTANPSATFGLSVTLASYGAAFGDAVGAALLNPTVNGTLALLVSEEQNALIDNAERFYQAGIPLDAEPFHLPLQGEAFPIPNAGGTRAPIDWVHSAGSSFDYAQLSSPQISPLTIVNAPSTFTLDTQHYGSSFISDLGADQIIGAGNGDLFTLILGDSTAPDSFGEMVSVGGYPTVHIVANASQSTDSISADSLTNLQVLPPDGSNFQLLISGNGSVPVGIGQLILGDTSASAHEGAVTVSVSHGTITAVGQELVLGVTDAKTIDASDAPSLLMLAPAFAADASGVTVVGGTSEGQLQGSLGGVVSTVMFTNNTSGVWATIVGADNFTSESSNADTIFGDGGPDTISLRPNHSSRDQVVFGQDEANPDGGLHVLAITDSSDVAYPGSWAASVPTAIPTLFSGSSTGGTSNDITSISGFRAGSGGDELLFKAAAWNGASSAGSGIAVAHGDLVVVDGILVVSPGAAKLSAPWVDSTSNNSLLGSENVLLYAPSDAPLQNAQQLATQLHTSSDAIVLPGGTFIPPGQDSHILVAYQANNAVHIADVDLVNMSGSPQNSTNNLNVYASDMVNLTGVSLTSLTPDNIHFF